MTTHFYSHSIFTEHHTPDGHPERSDRIDAVHTALSVPDFSDLVRFDTEPADESLFYLAHPRSYIDDLSDKSPVKDSVPLDPDTFMSPRTWECVQHAVGGGIALVDSVLSGSADNGFLCARPPGHHAEKTVSMGFCLVNTAAVMARYIQQQGVERVAIVDFDVHHGNGTQDIFFEDSSVFFGSTHQMPLYPGTGAKTETGVGNICNAPLSSGMDGAGFKEAFESRILPELANFSPEFIIISAGFDAHRLDPLAGLNLEAEDFDWATGKLLDMSVNHSSNRIVSLLEGGYDLEGLSVSCAAHVRRLMRG